MRKILFIIIIFLFPIFVFALEYPALNSKNVEIYDLTDEKILYEIRSEEVSSIASLTKIATTITALENIENLNEKVTITNQILKTVSWEASKAGLKAGEKLTYMDLLYASMLPSGADATNSIAILSSGSIENYVKKMNELAKKIGLINTNFVNVTGLDEDNHYSTASDVTKLLIYALKNPIFKKIYTSKQYKMSNGAIVKNTFYTYYKNSKVNTSKILGNKTGHTLNAGYCLSSLSNINGHEVIIVSLRAIRQGNNFYNIIDTAKLIDFLEENYDERILVKKDQTIKNIKVRFGNINYYEVKAVSDVTKYLPVDYDISSLKFEYIGSDCISFVNKKGKKIGTIKYYYDNKIFYQEDVILNQEIKINFTKIITAYWYYIVIIFMLFVFALNKIRCKL